MAGLIDSLLGITPYRPKQAMQSALGVMARNNQLFAAQRSGPAKPKPSKMKPAEPKNTSIGRHKILPMRFLEKFREGERG